MRSEGAGWWCYNSFVMRIICKRFFVVFVIFVMSVGIAGVAWYFFRGKISGALLELSKAQLPSVTKADGISMNKSANPDKPPTAIQNLTEINLDVPFSSQAPLKDWGMPYQEACEEMSAILVDVFYRHKKSYAGGRGQSDEVKNGNSIGIDDVSKADEAVKKLVEWEQANFGFYKHTTAEDTARILREYFGFERVEVRYDITLHDIKREVAAGRPVIVPLSGRKVGNIFYRRPGPVYHMLVVRGFTNDGRIITNDVGTQHGENYPYDENVFFAAIHDAASSGDGIITEEEILKGRKAMIVVQS